MSVHGQTVIQWLEQLAPKNLAEEWDNVGLQIGTLEKQMSKVMVALDVTEAVVDEAIEQKADLIIAHHPLLFKGVTQIRTDLPYGRILAKCIKHDLTVYAAHTNLDIAPGGMNDWLANRIGLEKADVLSPTGYESLKKLMVFVPRDHEAELREALGRAGAGFIGNYSHCTFRTEGIGTFLPGEGTNPYIGTRGQIEQVEEVKIETVFPASIEKKVLQAMNEAHPYEEVAYDVFPLDQKGDAYGLGRIGDLPDDMSFREFIEHVKRVLDVRHCRYVGKEEEKVKKIALVGGSGRKYARAAQLKGADVFLTGDIDYHTAVDAQRDGLKLVDPGHHIEKVMIQGVQEVIQRAAQSHQADLSVIGSTVHKDPFSFS